MMRRTIVPILAVIFLSGSAWAQRTRATVDLTGFWERKDAAGSGSFGGIDAKIPKAVLVPGVQTAPPGGPPNLTPAGDATPHKPGDPYIVTNGRCGGGMPFIMGHSAALDIVQT